MNSNRQHMEWIEKYLDGRLTAGELEVFERMQAEDGSFKELLADMKLLVSGIRCSARDSLKEEIRGWERNQPELTRPLNMIRSTRIRRIGWVSLAAAACLAAVLYLGIFSPSPDERIAGSVFREYYTGVPAYIENLTVRSGEKVMKANQEAFDAYELGDYTQAAQLFSAIPEKSDTVFFYLGSSWMALKEYDKAIPCFRTVKEARKYRLYEPDWYLAGCLLKTGMMDGAEKIYRELSAGRNPYQSKAMEIIKKISSNK